MIIIGVVFQPEFQQMASVDTDTGEFQEKRLAHREEAETFYRALAGQKVRVGMEASGQARWFERLVAELQFELWMGDAAEIRRKRVRKQKTDRQDAQLILRLLLENRFPQNIGCRAGRTGICGNCSASSPHGAGAHPDHESTASRGPQRTALQEAVVARTRTAAAGVVSVGTVGKPATTRSAEDGSTEPDHRGTNPGDRAASREVSGGRATEDTSRSRCLDRTGLRADHRPTRALSVRQAGGELSGAGTAGRVQWQSATARADLRSRGVRCCASCWWKQRRSQCAACRIGAANIFT